MLQRSSELTRSYSGKSTRVAVPDRDRDSENRALAGVAFRVAPVPGCHGRELVCGWILDAAAAEGRPQLLLQPQRVRSQGRGAPSGAREALTPRTSEGSLLRARRARLRRPARNTNIPRRRQVEAGGSCRLRRPARNTNIPRRRQVEAGGSCRMVVVVVVVVVVRDRWWMGWVSRARALVPSSSRARARFRFVRPGKRLALATRSSRISATTSSAPLALNVVGHFCRAPPGQFSQAVQASWVRQSGSRQKWPHRSQIQRGLKSTCRTLGSRRCGFRTSAAPTRRIPRCRASTLTTGELRRPLSWPAGGRLPGSRCVLLRWVRSSAIPDVRRWSKLRRRFQRPRLPTTSKCSFPSPDSRKYAVRAWAQAGPKSRERPFFRTRKRSRSLLPMVA